MKELKFRNLTKDEVEVRVGAGGTLLLYKTARVDANLLDEVVGQFNWQKKFYQVKQTMICSIGIYDEDRHEWVWKDDAGDESQTEAIKGEASDSFKRAGFAWGIGRSLYTAPKIKLPNEYKDSKFFDVSVIEYNSKNEISHLVITTNFGKDVVYQYPKQRNTTPPEGHYEKMFGKGSVEEITKGIADTFDSVDDDGVMCSQETKDKILEITGKYDKDKYERFKSYMAKNFGCSSIAELTESQGQQLLKALGGK